MKHEIKKPEGAGEKTFVPPRLDSPRISLIFLQVGTSWCLYGCYYGALATITQSVVVSHPSLSLNI